MPGPTSSPDGCLALFGGLDAGLPALAADPGLAAVNDRAPLRRLAADLAAAVVNHYERAADAAGLAGAVGALAGAGPEAAVLDTAAWWA
ncbi:hypothetical protein ACFFX1_27970 [Dactylosporangium sucinum]|uniref:hypothetical protein n=1 Tax=Dactylosporangium sucinum TaxID=1424081 RepID=UPI00167CA01C|nr:hypothetical protein [Dactylosporangium sucinum]